MKMLLRLMVLSTEGAVLVAAYVGYVGWLFVSADGRLRAPGVARRAGPRPARVRG